MYVEPPELLAMSDKPRQTPRPRFRIAYIPHEDMGNAYTDRMRELMAGLGEVGPFAGIKPLLKRWPRTLRRYDAIIINWLDNSMVDYRSGRISLRKVAKLFFRTLLMRAFSRRMVFVRHNNYPHHTAPDSRRAAKRLLDIYETLFDVVLTHSGAATDRKRHYCPHPLYRPVTATAQRTALVSMGLPEEYFLTFGRIVPYKRIDALIEQYPPNKNLVVAGIVGDAAYAECLAAMRRANFIFLPGRLGEPEAQRLVSSARGIIIANADEDIVVSGTFFYAISFGCPVYAVATPFLRWARERIGDELLVLANDLKELCRMISEAGSRKVSDTTQAAVLREFGDRAVINALTEALA